MRQLIFRGINMSNQKVKDIVLNYEDEMIAMRRYLHTHPELSGEEFKTTKYIANELTNLGLEYRLIEPTGIIVDLEGSQPGKTVLLRADMDALPINELNDHLEYKSVNEGVMHACGHDSHVAMLFTALRALLEVKDSIKGTVRFIFQPAEEIAQGASWAIDQGVLEGVDNAFGIHIWTVDETGQISCPSGPAFAAADQVTVKFNGVGGHAAQPHLTKDAVVMASQFVTNAQSVVSRVVDPIAPAVLTFGKITGGDRWNVIAANTTVEGTLRIFDQDERDKAEQAIRDYANHIAEMHDGTAEVEYIRLTEPVNNEDRSAALVQEVAAESFGNEKVQNNAPTMGAEDFGFYMTEIPGAFATVGCANIELDTTHPHHSAHFNVDEAALKTGAELYANYALAYLNQDEF